MGPAVIVGARPGEPKVDTFQLLGRVDYDAGKKAVTRFDFIAFSPTGHYDEVHRKVLPLAILFELSPGATPADRAAPSSFDKHYFSKAR